MANMVQLIKQAALEANEASKPVSILFGEVISEVPLQIEIDQKIKLTEEFLVLSNHVKDYKVEVELKLETKEARTEEVHNHDIDTTTIVTVKNKLKQGEHVILLRAQGGQKYIVLDKVGE